MEPRRARNALLVVAFAAAVTMSGVAEAQDVGYDPTKVLVTLVSVTADAEGCASAEVTLPPETTPGFEVIAAGVDSNDERRSVIATVAGDETDRSVHVEACGFKPFSTVVFSVRFTAASEAGPSGTGSGSGTGTLPLTGSNVGLLVALAVAALLLGTPLALGTRLTSRFSRADAED